MKKEVLIVDLDNTIYPVNDTGYIARILLLISESGDYSGNMSEIRSDIMRRPFLSVAENYSFSDKLKSECMTILSDTACYENLKPNKDYKFLAEIPCRKFLVTAGLARMQENKIKQLNIEKDFEKIYIIDTATSDLTKKDVFRKILQENDLLPEKVLVIGDDRDSEIKAAKELGIDAVLYNIKSGLTEIEGDKVINNFKELVKFL